MPATKPEVTVTMTNGVGSITAFNHRCKFCGSWYVDGMYEGSEHPVYLLFQCKGKKEEKQRNHYSVTSGSKLYRPIAARFNAKDIEI